MSSLSTNVELLVATVELLQTRSVLSAIKTADLSGAAEIGKGNSDRFERGHVFKPEDRYAPRRVIHPQPRIEPRAVLAASHGCTEGKTTVRLANEPLVTTDAPAAPVVHDPLFEPPWRKVPWNEPLPVREIVKVVVRPPDIVRTGRLIDFYL